MAGATTVIAVDVDDRKLEMARAFGATHDQLRGTLGGPGASVPHRTRCRCRRRAVGRPETYEQAFYARDLAGTVVLVGVPTPDNR